MRHHEAPIRQITLRGFEPDLERRIRELARSERISLNQAALRLLRRGAGLDRPPPNQVGDSLDFLVGTWSDDEERQFLAANAQFERIDAEHWK